ncbi:MAG: hypothetical protein HoeaKO_35940 [Hoeflea alexandrii]
MNAIREAHVFSLRAGMIELFLRQGHTGHMHAVILGCVEGQRAPAEADVEHLLTGLEAQLAADHLQLVGLHLVNVIVPVGAVAAGVNHLVIEEEFIERVGDIVVIGDVLLVLFGIAI